jgi:DNA polymerase I
VIAAMIKLHRD